MNPDLRGDPCTAPTLTTASAPFPECGAVIEGRNGGRLRSWPVKTRAHVVRAAMAPRTASKPPHHLRESRPLDPVLVQRRRRPIARRIPIVPDGAASACAEIVLGITPAPPCARSSGGACFIDAKWRHAIAEPCPGGGISDSEYDTVRHPPRLTDRSIADRRVLSCARPNRLGRLRNSTLRGEPERMTPASTARPGCDHGHLRSFDYGALERAGRIAGMAQRAA